MFFLEMFQIIFFKNAPQNAIRNAPNLWWINIQCISPSPPRDFRCRSTFCTPPSLFSLPKLTPCLFLSFQFPQTWYKPPQMTYINIHIYTLQLNTMSNFTVCTIIQNSLILKKSNINFSRFLN